MKRYRLAVCFILVMSLLAGCQDPAATVSQIDPNVPAWMMVTDKDLEEVGFQDTSNKPRGGGWLRLFNGQDLTGWVQRVTDRPASFVVEDGVLRNVPPEGTHGNDIYTEEKFQDFELYYEYRIPAGSNSGVYLRGRYEIQVMDDYGKPPGVGGNGALYRQCAPSRNVSAKPGEWQSVRAKIVDREITVILNQIKVIDGFTVSKPTGGELDRDEHLPGPILLQGDHGPVEYRHLYLRPLTPTDGK